MAPMELNRKTILLLVFCLFAGMIDAQTGYRWIETMGSPQSPEFALDVDVDEAGNIYVGGEFFDGAVIGGQTYSSIGDNDLFLTRISPYGDVEWVATYGSTQLDRIYAVDAAVDGSVYLTGYGKVNFPSLTGSLHARDVLVARFDNQGNLIWGRNLDGDVFSEGTDIVGNALGESYMVARMETFTLIDNVTITGNGGQDGLVVKWGPNGEYRWGLAIGGSSEDDIYAIGKDADENIVVGGYFTNSANVGILTMGGLDQEEAFLAKIDSAGNPLWAFSFNGIGEDKIKALKVAPDGSIYFAGEFTNSINVGGTVLNATNNIDIFFGKANPDGSVAWVQKAGGTSIDIAEDLDIDHLENIYLGGYYFGSFQIGSVTATSGGFDDMFIAKIDSSGNLLTSSFPHVYTTRDVFGMAVDAQQNIVAAGCFIDYIDLTGDTIYAINNGMDIFVTKYATLPQSMIIDSVVGLGPCLDSAFQVHYHLQGYYDNTNDFAAQLSNAAGGFGGAPTVGTLSATGIGGVIPCVVPPSTPNGAAYRVRMRSTTPVIFSADNGADLAIETQLDPALVLGGDTTICNGNDAFVTIPSGYASQIWSNGASTPFAVYSTPGPAWVQATDNNGCTKTVFFQIVDCTFLEPGFGKGVFFHPNPSQGRIQIQVEQGGAGEWVLDVLDANGRIVQQERLSEVSDAWDMGLDLGNAAEGIYFLRLRGENGLWTGKVALRR